MATEPEKTEYRFRTVSVRPADFEKLKRLVRQRAKELDIGLKMADYMEWLIKQELKRKEAERDD